MTNFLTPEQTQANLACSILTRVNAATPVIVRSMISTMKPEEVAKLAAIEQQLLDYQAEHRAIKERIKKGEKLELPRQPAVVNKVNALLTEIADRIDADKKAAEKAVAEQTAAANATSPTFTGEP